MALLFRRVLLTLAVVFAVACSLEDEEKDDTEKLAEDAAEVAQAKAAIDIKATDRKLVDLFSAVTKLFKDAKSEEKADKQMELYEQADKLLIEADQLMATLDQADPDARNVYVRAEGFAKERKALSRTARGQLAEGELSEKLATVQKLLEDAKSEEVADKQMELYEQADKLLIQADQLMAQLDQADPDAKRVYVWAEGVTKELKALSRLAQGRRATDELAEKLATVTNLIEDARSEEKADKQMQSYEQADKLLIEADQLMAQLDQADPVYLYAAACAKHLKALSRAAQDKLATGEIDKSDSEKVTDAVVPKTFFEQLVEKLSPGKPAREEEPVEGKTSTSATDAIKATEELVEKLPTIIKLIEDAESEEKADKQMELYEQADKLLKEADQLMAKLDQAEPVYLYVEVATKNLKEKLASRKRESAKAQEEDEEELTSWLWAALAVVAWLLAVLAVVAAVAVVARASHARASKARGLQAHSAQAELSAQTELTLTLP